MCIRDSCTIPLRPKIALCGVLRRFAAFYSVLQRLTALCSVLQRFAAFYCALQRFGAFYKKYMRLCAWWQDVVVRMDRGCCAGDDLLSGNAAIYSVASFVRVRSSETEDRLPERSGRNK